MCRLFGLSAAPRRVHVTFGPWDASDGTGLGVFTAGGKPVVDKQPSPACQDALDAKERASTTFLAHVRHASTGGLGPRNTHPFEQHGRLFAHNGVVGDLPRLETQLGDHRDLVAGDTDSERFFALTTKQIDAHDGDVGAGITAAARWLAENLPVYAINLVLTTPTELWALRYPDTHELFLLRRAAGGPQGDRRLDHAGTSGHGHARSDALSEYPAVVVASERMDDDPGWQPLRPGELLHVDDQLVCVRRIIIDHPPRHLLPLRELDARTATSRAAT
ncbi:MAG TPA: class II glutamine amidotransferase [Amycolatopsis sp.]|nr:class II glutamine amidotransferase [Amycolatopsis sp.]